MPAELDAHPFQSTLPVKGATGRNLKTVRSRVSIHAPREGSDFYQEAENGR